MTNIQAQQISLLGCTNLKQMKRADELRFDSIYFFLIFVGNGKN